jgi:hypothetical protein
MKLFSLGIAPTLLLIDPTVLLFAMLSHQPQCTADIGADVCVTDPCTPEAIEIHRKAVHRRVGWRRIDDILVNPRDIRSTLDFLGEVTALLQTEAWMIDLQMCLEVGRYYRILTAPTDQDSVSRVDLEKVLEVHI